LSLAAEQGCPQLEKNFRSRNFNLKIRKRNPQVKKKHAISRNQQLGHPCCGYPKLFQKVKILYGYREGMFLGFPKYVFGTKFC